MKSTPQLIRRATAIGAVLLCAGLGQAQTASNPPVSNDIPKKDRIPVEKVDKPDNNTEDTGELLVLSPFEVSAAQDKGYQATETLSGTRIRTDLKDVGSAISVYTKEFIRDIGATDNSTLLQYTTNAEVAGTHSTYAGLGNGTGVDESGNLRAPAGAQRVRGLSAADNTRDFFVTDIPTDFYNVDRVDIQRGPNSMLFGLGSPAGIINAALHNAEFRNFGSVEMRTGSYGSMRGSIDLNQQLIPKVLSIRVDALNNAEKYEQKQAFSNDKRLSTMLRYEPQLFGPSFHTSIKVKYEHGDISADRPRVTPPNDAISPFFRDVDPSNTSMFGGMSKQGVSNGYAVGANPLTTSNWLTAIADQQQPLWIIDGTSNELYRVNGGYINPGARTADGSIMGPSSGILGKAYSTTFLGLSNLPAYASNAHLPGYLFGQYRNMSMLDPTIFDFYHNLIDGPTKSEYERWNAYNIDLSQTALNDRIGVDFSYDRQKYKNGGEALLGGSPTITIDVLKNFQDYYLTGANGTTSITNPNYGRPFVVSNAGGSGNSYDSDRKYIRGGLFGELRAADFLQNSFLVKLLGKHRFNGVYSKEDYLAETRKWQMVANSRAWDAYWNGNDGSSNSITNRPPVAAIYLGNSVAGLNSASGANIPGVTANVTLPDSGVYLFDSTWKNPTGVNYGDVWNPIPTTLSAIYNPTAPPTDPNTKVTYPNWTQSSNPANYVGWNSNFTDTLMRYNDGQNQALLTGASKSLRVTKSFAGSWQGYLWNDSIITTAGWRYDEVISKGVTSMQEPNNRGAQNLNSTAYNGVPGYVLPDGLLPNGSTAQTNQTYSDFKNHSLSSGLVLHLNKLLSHDYLPINISLSYNKSDNFQVTNARRDIYGAAIANPTGKTKDWGILLSTKDQKYSFRAVKYDTAVKNASISGFDSSGLGGSVQQGMRVRNVYLYKLSAYAWDGREQSADRNTWATAWVDNTTGRPVAAGSVATGPANTTLQTADQATAMRDASINAWNNIQAYLTTKGYFAAWGYTPTTQSALTDRATYEAAKIAAGGTAGSLNPAPQYAPDPNTVYQYSYSAPQGFAVTSDTQSKGYEFELTANPLANWRVAFNASETTAIRTNIGGEKLDAFVSYMDAQMAGPAGDMRQYSGGYSGANEVRNVWNSWRGNYTLLKLQEGAAASELRKWRYNVTSTYTFSHGFLKGAFVGGSYRWQDKVVIGYPVVVTATSTTFNLSKPYYGPAEESGDVWVGYERKITDKVNWRIQLTVRNLLKKDGLIPTSVEPDGQTWASVRTKPVQEWFVTNTFSF